MRRHRLCRVRYGRTARRIRITIELPSHCYTAAWIANSEVFSITIRRAVNAFQPLGHLGRAALWTGHIQLLAERADSDTEQRRGVRSIVIRRPKRLLNERPLGRGEVETRQ